MNTPVHPELLSVAQVAQKLSVTPAAIRKWIAQRRVPILKLGRLTRIRACDLDSIISQGLPAPGTHPRQPRDH